MNKRILVVLLALTLPISVIAQKSDLTAFSIVNVSRTDIGAPLPNQSDYPYLAVSVGFRNSDLLANKSFLGKFNKIEYFYAEAAFSFMAKTQRAPLFFLQKKKDAFSTYNYPQTTVVRKVPLSLNGGTVPTISVNTDVTIKKQDIAVIKAITEKVGPVISDPTSIMGPGSVKVLYGFLDDVVKQLSDKKQVTARVNFDTLSFDQTEILPLSYDIVILKPAILNLPTDGFTIRVDNGELRLFRNGSAFRDYPYFIIEKGLSNYHAVQAIPSQHFAQNPNCVVSETDLNRLRDNLEKNSDQLSNSQLAAERRLIQLFDRVQVIKSGADNQNQPNHPSVRAAYNALYDFRFTDSGHSTLNQNLIQGKYAQSYATLGTCIAQQARRLAFNDLLGLVFPLLEKDLNALTNEELGTLQSYIENTKDYSSIVGSAFNLNVTHKYSLAESILYQRNFENLVRSIRTSTALSPALQNDVRTLTARYQANDKCRRCVSESLAALDHYGKLIKNESDLRASLTNTVRLAENIYNRGTSSLQNLNFLITRSGDPTLPSLRASIESLLPSVEERKNILNSKLANPIFDHTEKQSIESLMSELRRDLDNLSTLNERVLSFSEKNRQALSAAQ